MAVLPASVSTARRSRWRVGLLTLVRVGLTLSLLLLAYFEMPARSADGEPQARWLVLQLCVFAVIGACQLPAIVRSDHPVARAIEALALIVPLFLLIFARIYLESSGYDPAAFSEPLDRTAALYLTVTIFATVGFGDIVAETDGARLLVTVQMLLNLVLIGVGVKLLGSAARRGVARRQGQPSGDERMGSLPG
jgi:voltage-gated potassium channel